MSGPGPAKRAEWARRAAQKNAIVPHYFEVFPDRVIIICGNCRRYFSRNLIRNLDEPTFVCPEKKCQRKNWIPVKFDLRF